MLSSAASLSVAASPPMMTGGMTVSKSVLARNYLPLNRAFGHTLMIAWKEVRWHIAVASQAVTQLVAWIGVLSRYIDDTYKSLIWSRFTKSAAWSLTTKLVHRILHNLCWVGVLQSFCPGDNKAKCAQVLWGVFKTRCYVGVE